MHGAYPIAKKMPPTIPPAQIKPDVNAATKDDDPLGIKALEQAGITIKDVTPTEARPDSAIYFPARHDPGSSVTQTSFIVETTTPNRRSRFQEHFRPRTSATACRYPTLDEAWESDQEAYEKVRDRIMASLWGETNISSTKESKDDKDTVQVIATYEEFQSDDSASDVSQDSSSVYSREISEAPSPDTVDSGEEMESAEMKNEDSCTEDACTSFTGCKPFDGVWKPTTEPTKKKNGFKKLIKNAKRACTSSNLGR